MDLEHWQKNSKNLNRWKTLMNLQNTPIYYVRYRNKENKDKSLRDLLNKGGVTEVTTREEEE